MGKIAIHSKGHVWHLRDVILEGGERLATCADCKAVWIGGFVYQPTGEMLSETEVRAWLMRVQNAKV